MKSSFWKSVKKEFSWNRPIGSYNRVQILYSFLLRGKRYQLYKIRRKHFEYLNVGCGPSNYPGFINLDYQWRPHVHLCWDITRGIPLDSSSMKGIFAEHCLEHIPFSDCEKVLGEFYRILMPAGVVRIIVPDAELYINLYVKERRGETVEIPYVTAKDIEQGFTPIMAMNRIFRDHGHQYAYDARTLIALLERSGFKEIAQVKFLQGRDRKLLNDTEYRKVESLYLEATKPKP